MVADLCVCHWLNLYQSNKKHSINQYNFMVSKIISLVLNKVFQIQKHTISNLFERWFLNITLMNPLHQDTDSQSMLSIILRCNKKERRNLLLLLHQLFDCLRIVFARDLLQTTSTYSCNLIRNNCINDNLFSIIRFKITWQCYSSHSQIEINDIFEREFFSNRIKIFQGKDLKYKL